MIEIALDSLNSYFFKLKQELVDLQIVPFLAEDYSYLKNELYKFHLKVYNTFIEKVKDKQENLKKKEAKDEKFMKNYKDFEIYSSYISVFEKLLAYLRNAETFTTNPGINILINYFIKKIDNKTKFIIYPEYKLYCSYTNLTKLLEEFPPSLRELEIYDLPVFFLPSLNKDEIFFNSIVVHEIGHYIEEKNNIYKELEKIIAPNVFENDNIKDIINKTYNEEREQDSSIDKDFLFEQIKTETIKVWTQKLSKWIKEIISDIIGLKIIGLPFFFGFVKTFLIIYPDALGSEDHPPPWLRFNYLHNEIKKNILDDIKNFNLKDLGKKNKGKELRFGELIGKDLIMFEDYFSSIRSEQQLKKYKIELDIIKSIDIDSQVNPTLLSVLNQCKIEEYKYNTDNQKEIITLIDLINNFITPNEILDTSLRKSEPANILNILNASWLFFVYLIDNHYDLFNTSRFNFQDTPVIQQKLNNLILKAIELSEIHSYAKNNQEKIENT